MSTLTSPNLSWVRHTLDQLGQTKTLFLDMKKIDCQDDMQKLMRYMTSTTSTDINAREKALGFVQVSWIVQSIIHSLNLGLALMWLSCGTFKCLISIPIVTGRDGTERNLKCQNFDPCTWFWDYNCVSRKRAKTFSAALFRTTDLIFFTLSWGRTTSRETNWNYSCLSKS